MRSDMLRAVENRAGTFLALVAGTATLWLGFTHQLNLYINPKYVVFTMILAAVVVAGIVVSFGFKIRASSPSPSMTKAVGLIVLCVLAGFMLLCLRPATLTTASVNQRGMNTGSVSSSATFSDTGSLFDNTDYSQLGVKDWASILRQNGDSSFVQGKTADVTGFISADENHPDDVFYVSRFVISCCAVDAQPVGVPVYMPGWKQKYRENEWVRVEGTFIARQYQSEAVPSVLNPSAITNVKQPEDPYVY